MSKQTKRQRGRAFEIYSRNWLTEHGWTVRDFPPTSRALKIKGKMIIVSSSQDCLGADLFCIKQRDSGDEILLIQCTLHTSVKKRVEEFAKYFNTKIGNLDLQLWIKREDSSIDIKRCLPSGAVIDLGKIIRRKFYSLEKGYEY